MNNNNNNSNSNLRNYIKIFLKAAKYAVKFILMGIKELYKKLAKKIRFSITFKITSVYAVILTFILLFFSLSILLGFGAYLGFNAENNILKDSKMVAAFFERNKDIPEKDMDEVSSLENVNINIFDDRHKLIYTTLKNSASVIFYDEENSYDISNSNGNYKIVYEEENFNFNSSPVGIVIETAAFHDSEKIYIQVVDKLEYEFKSIVILSLILLCAVILFMITILAIGSRASRKMLHPIESMTKTVKNITINALDTRLNVSGSQDELKDLAETFNSMLDRIQESYEQQNQFVSDASHELRTPISVIQGYANLLDRWGKNDKEVLEESIAAIKTEAEGMKDLIEKLLFLARGDKNTQKLNKENFYINELVDEVIKETAMIDTSHNIVSHINEAVSINADRKLIKELLRILIDNSIKYTPENGTVIINCASHTSHSSDVMVSVEDNGIGIANEELPYIFNRFYRADKSRTKETGGTGLGLAIAKWIVLKHKGSIEAYSRVDEGTKITVFLPKN